MNARVRLFGIYVPGNSWVHRWPVGLKYLVMFGFGVAPFLVGQAWLSLLALAASVVLLLVGARLPAGPSLRLAWAFWLMMALLVAYHTIATSWYNGVLYLVNVIAAIYFARLVTMTTPVAELMDAIAAAARPLRVIGVDPERVALALALMWRSIPYLIGSVSDVRDAARARGLERSALRFVLPVIVGAVGYGLQTGDALRARGLDDRSADPPARA
ncbi:MAG: energy-coupling factor transporter transmembrane protein EcfT [Propionibacteriaceae bacterium]|nr:energy-coupling factor transporter transmembrane protein EcfT [Propionibacteriaceae bacterium]